MLYACIGSYADVPFEFGEERQRIYSLEELAYYIKENYESLDDSFMSSRLCRFVAEQLMLPELSDRLYEVVKKGGPLYSFASAILEETGFCSRSQQQEIEEVLQEHSVLTAAKRRKLKGDMELERKYYLEAIREYTNALNEIEDPEDELIGECLHNLGCCYAGMFYFREAAAFFKKAYDKSQAEDSYEQYLAALRLGTSREKYASLVGKLNLTEEKVEELEEKLGQLALSGHETTEFAIMQSAIDKYQKDDKEGCIRDLDIVVKGFKREFRAGMVSD